MISFVPFAAEHIYRLRLQKAQAWIEAHLSVDSLRLLENDRANTIMDDGRPILCAGAVPVWENRAFLWSFVDEAMRPDVMREVHYLAKRWIRSLPYRRIEMYVDVDFEAGHRWARALGFKMEAQRMRAFQVHGGDSTLYAKVSE